jgi:hypothetical protein
MFGADNPSFGSHRKHTPEELAKMSAAMRGRVFSEEHKAKLRAGSQRRWHGV